MHSLYVAATVIGSSFCAPLAVPTYHSLRVAAVTAHGEDALLLQSSVMSADVVFINADWENAA